MKTEDNKVNLHTNRAESNKLSDCQTIIQIVVIYK